MQNKTNNQNENHSVTLHKENNAITIEDRMILSFSGGKRIHHLSQSESVEIIGKHLDNVMQMVGLKNMPTSYMANKIIESIVVNFKQFSPIEIEYAFELAIMKKFECNLEHYQDLTLRYVSEVLIAYNKYRQEIIIESSKQKIKQLPEKQKPTDAEIKAEEFKFMEDIFNHCINCGFPLEHYGYSFVYKLCVKHGLFQDIFVGEPDESVKQLLKKAKGIIQNRQAKKDGILIGDAITNLMDASVVKQAKALYLIEYFKGLQHNKTNLKDILCKL